MKMRRVGIFGDGIGSCSRPAPRRRRWRWRRRRQGRPGPRHRRRHPPGHSRGTGVVSNGASSAAGSPTTDGWPSRARRRTSCSGTPTARRRVVRARSVTSGRERRPEQGSGADRARRRDPRHAGARHGQRPGGDHRFCGAGGNDAPGRDGQRPGPSADGRRDLRGEDGTDPPRRRRRQRLVARGERGRRALWCFWERTARGGQWQRQDRLRDAESDCRGQAGTDRAIAGEVRTGSRRPDDVP